MALGFAIGRGISDEKLSFQIVATEAVCLFLLTVIALGCAFIRRERLRWFTLVPLIVFLLMFGVGVS